MLVPPAEDVTEVRAGRVESVVRTEVVCPYTGGHAGSTDEISVLSLAEVEVDDRESKVTATALAGPDASPAPALEVTERGLIGTAAVKSSSPIAHEVQATGGLAAGLVAEQSLLINGADVRGVADARCVPPTRETWFVGGSGAVGHRGRLVLTNPDGAPALVDLTLWDEKGEVKAPASQDISVPPRGQRAVLLDALAPDSERLAVRAVTARGRVAMSLELRESKGTQPRGVTWVGGLPEPATQFYIAAVPGQGERTLQVLAPGDSDAIVKIRLLAPQGPFTPAGNEVLTVPAGTVAEVSLSDSAGDQPVAVEVDSDVPVAAAVRVGVDDGNGAEFAYSSPVQPLDAPTASLFARTGDGLASSLLLTNVSDESVTATVRTLTADGTATREQEVEVAAGTTTSVEITSPDESGRLAVVIAPGAGNALLASRVITGSGDGGPFLDVLPMPPALVSVRVPDVSWELSTGLSSDPAPPAP